MRWFLALAFLLAIAPGASAQAIYGSSGASVRVLCSDATQHPMGANTAETILATCTIPANALSVGSAVSLAQLWSFAANNDSKTFKVYLNTSPAIGGSLRFSVVNGSNIQTNLAITSELFAVRDANTEIGVNSFWGGFGGGPINAANYSIANPLYVIITGTQTASADNLALEQYTVTILPPGGN